VIRDLLRQLFERGRAARPDAERRLRKLLDVIVRAGLEPSAEEVADLLWLASFMASDQRRASSKRDRETAADDRTVYSSTMSTQQSSHPEAGQKAATSRAAVVSAPVPAMCRVYPKTDPTGALRARVLHAPGIRYLSNSRGLVRALRLLGRRLPSRRRVVLDVEATVDLLAEQCLLRRRPFRLKLRRVPERQFTLTLVIDCGRSMRIWDGLLLDVRQLLSYSGIFRCVRTCYLDCDGETAVLRAGVSCERSRLCHPREFRVGDGQNLILVATDGISRSWHTGSAIGVLKDWSKYDPLALLQILPPRMWPGTVLRRGVDSAYSATVPAPVNNRLVAADTALDRLYPDEIPELSSGCGTYLQLPVLCLQEESLRAWASLILGRKNQWVPGFLFDGSTEFDAISETEEGEPSAVDACEALRRFFAQASPQARRLAAYFAAAPLTIPVMRLIQGVMLPRSTQIHMAEVFDSGLLRRVPDLSEEDTQFFDFHRGLRPRLLDLISRSEAAEVLLRVSSFVGERTGQVPDFRSYIEDNYSPGNLRLDHKSRYFAEIAAHVLRRLGGEYRALADRLEGQSTRLEVTSREREVAAGGKDIEPHQQPLSFRDPFIDGTGSSPRMMWLPGGDFSMGDAQSIGDGWEQPVHEVVLSHFAIGMFPVTFDEFDRFCRETGNKHPRDYGWGRASRPVIDVSWIDANRYCEWLTEKANQLYRLPTEAEWEYACRAGNRSAFSFGDEPSLFDLFAWYAANSVDQSHPVGEKRPNQWGLFDMHGNIWEWVRDHFGEYPSNRVEDPGGPSSGTDRVIRGGSWSESADQCRCSCRVGSSPDRRLSDLGFRVVRSGPLNTFPFPEAP
jgi:formylglycine-generating enzyme required for sulfatase activity